MPVAVPAADFYTVAPGGVIAGGRDYFFSSGTELGSFNAGTRVWTPGRDANGVVTRASWEQVPIDGSWIEVAGSAFTSQVQPQLTAALPTYNDPGSSDLADVLDNYNGFAHDIQGGRLFAHGGGHQGSANNGLYKMDLRKLQWSIAKLPDMQTYWPAGYKANPPTHNSFTVYDRAVTAVNANPTTTDFWHDEFYDLVEPLANTRNPTSRHTYNAMVFANGKLRHGVRRYWEWDEATNSWLSKFPLGKNATSHQQAGGGFTGELVKGTWDEVNNRYICGPIQIAGVPYGFWQYNANTQVFSGMGGITSSWEAYVAAACRIGRKWVFFARPVRNNADFWPPKLKVTDLDTNTLSTVTLSGLTQSKCIDSSKSDESTSMEYVPGQGVFCLMPYDMNDLYAFDAHLPLEPFWINPDTGVMTHEPQTGKFPSLWSYHLLKNKMVYVPQLKALVIVPNAGTTMRIRRFA